MNSENIVMPEFSASCRILKNSYLLTGGYNSIQVIEVKIENDLLYFSKKQSLQKAKRGQ